MIQIKNTAELDKMRKANQIIAELFEKMHHLIVPGVSTYELDRFAEQYILSQSAKPAFKGYRIPGLAPFPGAICASINDCIVHGIPSKKVLLKEGDIIGIDVGVLKDGFHGDAARTFRVGAVSEAAEHLLQVTKEALNQGISQARAGARVGDISNIIGSYVQSKGYFIADNLTGHGIGKKLHEDPIVPNDGPRGKGPRLRKGMTIAIEPMVNIGTNQVIEKGWEYFVMDGSLSAHFEHTIAITNTEPELLSNLS
jgi:methionyl aminopeptidase